MQTKMQVHWWHIGFLALLCLCGKSNKQEVSYGPDSLNSGKIRALMAPDASPDDPAQVRQTLFRYSLAKMANPAKGQVDSASVKLARRITLESGKEWSPEAASLLLSAAMALEARARIGGIASVIAFVDSVFAIIDKRPVKDPKVKGEFAWLDTVDLTDRKAFGRIVAAVFGVSQEVASTLMSFMGSGPRTTKDASVNNIGKMVRGILSKKAPHPLTGSHADAVAPELEREKSRSALLALKYRPQQSIRDSIARHLPDLEVIYKKQLKLNEMSGGLVWVVFRVDAEGRVLSAKIKSSAIANRQFQQLLEEYVRTIHFKAIPKDMEPMIFEFPFEFKSEG